ncbi:hypothetical protein [Kutzneria buriramensis]|uniref:Uncharacterized protein n=1 Tax=Kutzneria buriramensis TaxID=1045776 RepID=A0A3E0HGW4_9PSEU|nr:hypothetical protein [Kutzneria buriramensis]REH44923.1 hypothetical protein BCF44_108404 [Kutzneria buriramensis]
MTFRTLVARSLLASVACAVSAAGLIAVGGATAQAASLPCNLGSNGSSASVTCYSGSHYTWRLVVDCLDTSNIQWPRTVYTITRDYHTGDGTDSATCSGNLKASARIEAK